LSGKKRKGILTKVRYLLFGAEPVYKNPLPASRGEWVIDLR